MAKSNNSVSLHGGAGRGQGQKPKYGEETKLIRVPVSLIPGLEKKMAKMAQKQAEKIAKDKAKKKKKY